MNATPEPKSSDAVGAIRDAGLKDANDGAIGWLLK